MKSHTGILALALSVLLLVSGCMAVGEFFIGVGFLVACGPMPMSPDDCTRKPPAPPATPATLEHP
mgnify:FL=1